MRMHTWLLSALVMVAFFTMLAGCDSDDEETAGPAFRISLVASPTTVAAGSNQPVTLTATVLDQEGRRVRSYQQPIAFILDNQALGNLSGISPTTNGVATATFTPGNTVGTVVVTASSDALVPGTVQVDIGPPQVPVRILLTAEPDSVPASSAVPVVLTAMVVDDQDRVVGAYTVPITFSLSNPAAGTLSQVSNTVAGVATALFLPAAIPGAVTITARSGLLTPGTVQVTITSAPPNQAVRLVVLPASTVLPANGFSPVTITATAVDPFGGRAIGFTQTITFTVNDPTLGTLSNATPTTQGQASVIFTASTVPGVAVITASADQVAPSQAIVDTRGITGGPLFLMQGTAFIPQFANVSAGQPVTWLNADPVLIHRVVSDTGLFDSGPLDPGQSFTYPIASTTAGGTRLFFHDPAFGSPGNGVTVGAGMAGGLTVLTPVP